MRMVILRGLASASRPISYTPLSTIGRTGNGLVPAELVARLPFALKLEALMGVGPEDPIGHQTRGFLRFRSRLQLTLPRTPLRSQLLTCILR